MTITLVQFWTAELATLQLAQAGAQSDLSSAQAALTAAQAALAADSTVLATLGTAIAADRSALANTSVPSAVTALNAKIRDEIIQQRMRQGMILDDQESIARAQASLDTATAALARATAAVADAGAQLSAATEAAGQRKQLADQLVLPPFSTMKADATAFAGSGVASDAKNEIKATFPTDLLAIATARHDTRTQRLADLQDSRDQAEDALGAAQTSSDGLAGDAAHMAIAFRRAAADLQRFVTTAKLRYDRAVTVMSDLQAMKNGTLTPDLLSAQEKTDIAATAARSTAETNALKIDTKRGQYDTALNALDAALVTQINADVDALRTSATLLAKRTAATSALNALVAAETAFNGSADDVTIDQWEAVVQDGVWGTLIDYLDAVATLAELKATTPTDFANNLVAAEDAYAVALGKATKAKREEDAFTDEIAIRSARADAATTALPGRLLSAVRGDSF